MIGDPRQIGAVGPGGLYGNYTNEFEPIYLTEIRRQRDPVDRRMVELAHEGRGSDALDLLRTRERLVIADTLPEALDAQALDWHRHFAAGEDAVMIARRTRDVANLNERAREILIADGRLGAEALNVGGQPFAVGDRVVTRINTPQVSNRERWEVVGVDAGKGRLDLRSLSEETKGVTLDRRYLDKATASGEPAVQHAYALTTYSTESKTFDSAFALLDSGISREDFTVAISRARGATVAYGVAASVLTDEDLGPGRREIEDVAHELRPDRSGRRGSTRRSRSPPASGSRRARRWSWPAAAPSWSRRQPPSRSPPEQTSESPASSAGSLRPARGWATPSVAPPFATDTRSARSSTWKPNAISCESGTRARLSGRPASAAPSAQSWP